MEIATSPEIQITSVFFRHNPEQVRFESFPKHIIYKGRRYELAEN